MAKSEAEESKKGILSEIAEIPGEVMPEDLRANVLRTAESLTTMVETTSYNAGDRLLAARQVESIYQTVLAKWLGKDYLDKADRTNNRALNAIHENRKKPWDKNSDEEE